MSIEQGDILINKEIESSLLEFASKNKLYNVEPRIISESGNLVIQLYPYKIVARIAIYNSNSSDIYETMQKEIDVARYLLNCGVEVISPNTEIYICPIKICDYWMTLWDFEEEHEREKLSISNALIHIKNLTSALESYNADLPVLGVWRRINKSADNLVKREESKLSELIYHYNISNDDFNKMDIETLVPSHGDAHSKNLYSAESSWLWMDFEDASLMPKYWDLASFFANIILFNGLKTTIIENIIENKDLVKDKMMFMKILKSRIVMSIIGNLDFAYQGLGDLEFAELQLSKFEELIIAIDDYCKVEDL